NIWTIGHEALICDHVFSGSVFNQTFLERNRFVRVTHVLYEGFCFIVCLGCDLAISVQEELTSVHIFWRPLVKILPFIGASEKDVGLRRVEGSFTFWVVFKERCFKFLLVIQACFLSKADIAKIITFSTNPSSMEPRSHYQDGVILFVAFFDLFVGLESTIRILCIVKTANHHYSRFNIV